MMQIIFHEQDMSNEGVEAAWSGRGVVRPWLGYKRLIGTDGFNFAECVMSPDAPREVIEAEIAARLSRMKERLSAPSASSPRPS